MRRLVSFAPRWALSLGAGALLLVGSAARADIPAGYKGKPFDPAVAGGAGIVPPTVKAGPYAVPGRIDFANYDMGGDGVGYHSDAHYTTKDGDGYRSDRPAATMCKTLNSKPDLFYDTGVAAQDGMFYPTATTNDFYVGSIHPNDWFNYTVDVKTAGTYTLSGVFATGNGPPGGEGGDGQMELIVFVNETKVADWKTTFPDFQNKANFHNWKPYPSFATITLAAGVQVIKFQAPFKHLNLDYVQLDLMGGGAAGTGGGAAGTGAAAGTGGGAAGTGASTTGEAGTGGGAAGTGGGAAGTGAGAAGTGAAGTAGPTTGAAGVSGATPGAKDDSGCACATGGPALGGGLPLAFLLAATALARRRRNH